MTRNRNRETLYGIYLQDREILGRTNVQRENFMSLLNGMTSDMYNRGNYWLKHIGTLFEFTNGSVFGRTKSQRVCSRVSGSLKVNTLKVLLWRSVF